MAVISLPGALRLSSSLVTGISVFRGDVIAAEAGTQSSPQVLPDTATPAQPQDQAGLPLSAPSTTSPEEQKKPAPGSAQQEGEKLSTQPTATAGQGATIVDILHGGISSSILSTATWLDSFFGDKRYASELNTSYVRFGYNVFLEQGTGPLLKPDLQVRVVLPQLREKTHLVISGAPKEDNEFSAVNSRTTAETDQFASTGEDRNVTTALHYVPLETFKQNFAIRAGLKLHRARPAVLLGPRYRILLPFENGWSIRLVEDVAWRSDKGWLTRSTVDLERPLPRNLFFRTSTEWVRETHVDGYIYSYSVAIRQPLSERRALEYEWLNIFQTKPVNELEEIDLRIHFRRRVSRDWFYIEVMPQYRFPRSRGFEATPGILFRFEMFFGSYT